MSEAFMFLFFVTFGVMVDLCIIFVMFLGGVMLLFIVIFFII